MTDPQLLCRAFDANLFAIGVGVLSDAVGIEVQTVSRIERDAVFVKLGLDNADWRRLVFR